MSLIKICRLSVFALLVLLCILPVRLFAVEPSRESHVEEIQVIDIGVLATRGSAKAQDRWLPTLTWLESQLPQFNFVLHPFTLEELASAVKNQTVDFIITNPGQAVMLGRQFSLSWLATLISTKSGGTTDTVGSALVVRTPSPYYSFEDVAGQRIAAVSEQAFGGYQTLKFHLKDRGSDPERFFANVIFSGFPVDVSLYQLKEGYVEAAVVPICQLESMVAEGLLNPHEFRVIGSMAPLGFSCQASTALYPNWSFAKTDNVSSVLAKRVTLALLALPVDHQAAIAARSLGWTAPTSPLIIDKLYSELAIHPLQRPWWQSGLIWLKGNQQWGWFFVLLIVILNGYHFLLEYRFSRSQKQLLETEKNLKEKRAMLEHAQRVSVIGELGSSLAHELNQPLAAIRNYSQGGLLRINKGHTAEEIAPIFDKVQQQVIRADEIVQRIRSLINKRPIEKRECDPELLISDTLQLLEYELESRGVTIQREQSGQARNMLLDPVGFQQLVLNLLNNAADACVMATEFESAAAAIKIETDYGHYELILKITDNGVGLNKSQDTLASAFYTTKQDGLGLGLVICHDFVEAHEGQFTLSNVQANTQTSGCIATVTLPYK